MNEDLTWAYSPSKKAFYDKAFGYDALPEDSIHITEDERNKITSLSDDEELYVNNGIIEKRKIINIDYIKKYQEKNIRKAYLNAEKTSVFSNGLYWNGGIESYSRIKNVIDYSKEAGLDYIELTDIDNVSHTLTYNDAMVVYLTIAETAQINFLKKQRLLTEINEVTLNTNLEYEADIMADKKNKKNIIENIVW